MVHLEQVEVQEQVVLQVLAAVQELLVQAELLDHQGHLVVLVLLEQVVHLVNLEVVVLLDQH
jgi:hypothetical protein